MRKFKVSSKTKSTACTVLLEYKKLNAVTSSQQQFQQEWSLVSNLQHRL